MRSLSLRFKNFHSNRPAASTLLWLFLGFLLSEWVWVSQNHYSFFVYKLITPWISWKLFVTLIFFEWIFLFSNWKYLSKLVVIFLVQTGTLLSMASHSFRIENRLSAEVDGWRYRYPFLEEAVPDLTLKHIFQRLTSTIPENETHDWISWTHPYKLKNHAVVFIHGGGWDSGSPREFQNLFKPMYSEGYDVYFLKYPLAPGALFPQQRLKLYEASKKLKQEYAFLSLIGRSAGGHLALDQCLQYPSLFKNCVSIYAPTDLTFAYQSSGEHDLLRPKLLLTQLMGSPPDQSSQSIKAYQDASPLRVPEELLKRSPPILFLHGSEDSMVWFYHSARLHEALLRLRKTSFLLSFPGFTHGFELFSWTSVGHTTAWVIQKFIASPEDTTADSDQNTALVRRQIYQK